MTADTNHAEPMKGLAEWLMRIANNFIAEGGFQAGAEVTDILRWAAEVEASRLPLAGAATSDEQWRVSLPDGIYTQLPGDPPGPGDVRKVVNGLVFDCEPRTGKITPAKPPFKVPSPAPSDAAVLPVAHRFKDMSGAVHMVAGATVPGFAQSEITPLCSLPTGARMPLSDERLVELHADSSAYLFKGGIIPYWIVFARAIEAEHGITLALQGEAKG